MAKTVTYWPWWQPLNRLIVFALRLSLFFLFSPFFSLPPSPLTLLCRRPWKINFGLSLKCVMPYTMKQCYELNLPYSVGKYLLKVGTVPSAVVLYKVFCWLLCCICSKWEIETLNIYLSVNVGTQQVHTSLNSECVKSFQSWHWRHQHDVNESFWCLYR